MASQTVLLVTLMSFVSWIASGTLTVKEILEMEENFGDDSSEWNPRIIGGRQAEEKEFPWVAALHRKGRFICTSFIITPTYIMTAAHCVKFSEDKVDPPENFKAYVGTIKRDGDGPDSEVRISEVICHEEYGSGTEYDIAMLKAETAMETSDSIQPICLPAKGTDFDDTMAQAMGWGVYRKYGRQPSPVLLTVTEHVPENADCRCIYRDMGVAVTKRHVCAGGSSKSGVCFGDSGGPLVYPNATRPIAIGVASFVSYRGCAANGVPGVYTSTSSYLDWIQESMGDSASDLCVI